MRKLLIFAQVVSLLLLAGCNDKLDIRPKGTIVLSSVDELSSLLDNKAMLSYPTELAWYACFDAGAPANMMIGDSYPFIKASYLGDESINRITNFASDGLYNNCYERISRYNIIIEDVMDADGAEADKLRTRAEALVLRAYNYFVLVNTFCKSYNKETANTDGGLLLRTRFSIEENPKQVSVEEVYALIEKDLNDALPYLGPKGKNVNHPGLAFAYGVLAKVHLFKHEFDKAEVAATESLKNNSYIFDWVAWDLGPKPVPEIGYSNEENLYFGYGYSTMSAEPIATVIGPHLVQKYTPGDLRKERFFFLTMPSYFLPGCAAYQAYTDIVNGKKYKRSYKYNEGGMKVSEVVLMLAECYARSGKVAEAMDLVNNLRKKRVLPTKYADLVANNKDEAFNHVMDERSRELPATANNFYDIRRLEAEGIRQSVERVIPEASAPDGLKRITVQSNSYVFVMPFPRDAMERSSLTQNVDK